MTSRTAPLPVILPPNIGLICKSEKLAATLTGWKSWLNWELTVNLVAISLNLKRSILVTSVVWIFPDTTGSSKLPENLISVFTFPSNKGLILWIWALICCNCCLVSNDVMLLDSKLISLVPVLNKVSKETGKTVPCKSSLMFSKSKFLDVSAAPRNFNPIFPYSPSKLSTLTFGQAILATVFRLIWLLRKSVFALNFCKLTFPLTSCTISAISSAILTWARRLASNSPLSRFISGIISTADAKVLKIGSCSFFATTLALISEVLRLASALILKLPPSITMPLRFSNQRCPCSWERTSVLLKSKRIGVEDFPFGDGLMVTSSSGKFSLSMSKFNGAGGNSANFGIANEPSVFCCT